MSIFEGLTRKPNDDEKKFAEALAAQIAGLDIWLHNDPDQTEWMMVSFDVIKDGTTQRTLRLDYNHDHLIAGISPAYLNWDAEMHAEDVGIKGDGPEELSIKRDGESFETLLEKSKNWFLAHKGFN